jgi:hypothetical protein
MKRLILRRAGLGLLFWLSCGLTSLAQTVTPPHDDQQSWNEFQLLKPLTKTKDLIIIGVLRIGRGFERPTDERIGAAVVFKLHKHLTLVPTYLHVTQQPYPGRRVHEHRLILDANLKFSLGQFNFTDRNRYERHARHDSRDFTEYRNRLQIDHPARVGAFQFRVYVADEVFYSTQATDTSRRNWYRNRVGVGAFKQFTERFYGELFYLHQNDGVSRPGNIHALGTLFRVSL